MSGQERRRDSFVMDGRVVRFVTLSELQQKLRALVGKKRHLSLYLSGNGDCVHVDASNDTFYMNPHDLPAAIGMCLAAAEVPHDGRRLQFMADRCSQIRGYVIIRKHPGKPADVEVGPRPPRPRLSR